MLIFFNDRKLEREFASLKEMTRAYAPEQGKVIARRLLDLQAAACLADLNAFPQLRPHELSGKRLGQLAINLRQPYRLIFRPDHDPLPRKEDGGLDWKQVTAITLLEVVDYH